MNSVNPTVVMTEMGRLGWSDPEKAKTMLSRIPLGHFAGETEKRDRDRPSETKRGIGVWEGSTNIDAIQQQ